MTKITRRAAALGAVAGAIVPISTPLAADQRLLVVNLHHLN